MDSDKLAKFKSVAAELGISASDVLDHLTRHVQSSSLVWCIGCGIVLMLCLGIFIAMIKHDSFGEDGACMLGFFILVGVAVSFFIGLHNLSRYYDAKGYVIKELMTPEKK